MIIPHDSLRILVLTHHLHLPVRKVRASQCFKRFHTAEHTLKGIEAMHMMRKGQVKRLTGSDAIGQSKFVLSLFQIAA